MLLSNALVGKLSGSDDLRYHLAWSFGLFLQEIPRRIGKNKALDAATAALVSAHSNIVPYKASSAAPEALAKYSHGLKTLRDHLSDPLLARTSETLCAVNVLFICSGLLGRNEGRWSGHGEGAAQILKARGYYNGDDEFERWIMLSLRGSVLVEALCNAKISFTPKQWKKIVENELDGSTCEGVVMSCLAKAPDLIERGTIALREGADLEGLITEANCQYVILKELLGDLYTILLSLEKVSAESRSPKTGYGFCRPLPKIYAYHQRLYGFALTFCMVFNCILKALDSNNAELDMEAADYCNIALDLAEQANMYRPLGSSWAILSLLGAWCCSRDDSTDAVVEGVLADYVLDFPGHFPETPGKLRADLQFLYRRLSLQGPS